ncbi:histidine kinase N-terminal 7TM domain-containing protein [Actinomycetes bacterium NPDC127524]
MNIFIYIVIISISGVFSVLLGILAFLKRSRVKGSGTFVLINITSCFYVFGHAFELTGTSLSEIEWMVKIQYLGLPFISPLNVLLALQFIGLDKYITRKNMILLFSVPVITVIMIYTNSIHHLFYKSIILHKEDSYLLADYKIGIFYIIHGSFTFGCLFAAFCILIWHARSVKSSYRFQLAAMMSALLLPMTASFLYLVGKAPYNMDPVPAIMCVTSALYLTAILSSNMLVVAPIARDRIIENMRDAVLVMDRANLIADFNGAAIKMFPDLNNSIIGREFYGIWKNLLPNSVLPELLSGDSASFEQEIEWNRNGELSYGLLHSFPVYKNANQLAGRAVIISDMTKEKIMRNTLQQMAYRDSLTNIFNRGYFTDKTAEMIEKCKINNSPLSLILFDIDHFKQINDTYGHAIGDEALKHVINISKKLIKPEYILARYGGEEFVISLSGVSIEEAGEIAEETRKSIAECILITGGEIIHITASFGAAEMNNHENLNSLFHDADLALYESKKRGRNTVSIRSADLYI